MGPVRRGALRSFLSPGAVGALFVFYSILFFFFYFGCPMAHAVPVPWVESQQSCVLCYGYGNTEPLPTVPGIELMSLPLQRPVSPFVPQQELLPLLFTCGQLHFSLSLC